MSDACTIAGLVVGGLLLLTIGWHLGFRHGKRVLSDRMWFED